MINLSDVINSHIVKFRNNLYTTIPAIITRIVDVDIDGEQMQTVNVSFAIDRNTVNGHEEEEALALPVVFPYASGWGLKLKLSVGDEVLVHLSMRPTEEWLLSDGSKPVQTNAKRMHDLNDGFAVPTLSRLSKGLSEGDYNIEIGDGQHNTIKFKDGEVLVSTEKANVKLTGDGDIYLTNESTKLSINSDGTIQLGEGAAESMVLGDTFMALFNAHTHPTGVGMSGAPAVPMAATELSANNKVL